MLDDATFVGRVEGVSGPPEWMAPVATAPGQPARRGISPCNGLFVSVWETGLVSVRLSVPRWLTGHPVNYPLVPLRGVYDLDLRRLRLAIVEALNLRVSAIGSDLAERLPIERWAYIRGSYAVDLPVSDPIRVVQGCLGIRRKYAARFDAHGSPTISTVGWHTKSVSAKLYAKGLELEDHLDGRTPERHVIERLAKAAERDLRFEATFRTVQGVRRLFGNVIGHHLPTLALMSDPCIDGWVLAREADRLRLFEPQTGGDRTTFPAHARLVADALRKAQERLARGEAVLERRKSLTPDRITDLIANYFLGAAHTPAEIASMLGKSLASVREAQAELRAIGIPVDASPFATMGSSVSEIANALDPYIPETWPPKLTGWPRGTGLVVPPWHDDGVLPRDLVEEEGEGYDEPYDDPDDEESLRLLIADLVPTSMPSVANDDDIADLLERVGT
jgi:hypothetical protein